ncbi:MAG: hypothetical protein ABW208_28350 [Pyrinomonadaceae bacterium]
MRRVVVGLEKVIMKYGRLKKGLAGLLLLSSFLAHTSAARQAPADKVTREEAAEARATAAAFAERLRATQDFGAVARELYADDFMSRQLKSLNDWAGRVQTNTFMLAGVPSLTFERSLAEKAPAEDWRRLRIAADNLLHFMFLSLLARQSFQDLGDPDKYDDRAALGVFPPEAVKVLGANPSLANFLKKQEDEVVIRTPEELRAVAAALEEAVRLTRPRLAESLAQGKHLAANLRLFGEGFSRDEVKTADAVAAGYPEGTRLFHVFAPNAYNLLLVRQGGAMKIVWAGLPSD